MIPSCRLLKASDKSAPYGASDIVFSLETPTDGSSRNTWKRGSRCLSGASQTVDEGRPGIRENYNANYYGAFARDLDGNKMKAVTFTAREDFRL